MDVLRSPARRHRRHVVADVRFVANGRDGIEVSMQFIPVWTTLNGQIVRFRGYPTLTEALEAVSR
jgi:ketosteroid isomerase-like protein